MTSDLLQQIERGLDGVTPGPWEGRYVPGGMPTNCVDYGVVSLSEGIETCRVWKPEDAAHYSRCSPDAIREIAAYVRDLEERLEKAAEALEPFSNEARCYDPDEGDDQQTAWARPRHLKIGDFRRARTALSQIRSEK